jgi:hypothetical protein
MAPVAATQGGPRTGSIAEEAQELVGSLRRTGNADFGGGCSQPAPGWPSGRRNQLAGTSRVAAAICRKGGGICCARLPERYWRMDTEKIDEEDIGNNESRHTGRSSSSHDFSSATATRQRLCEAPAPGLSSRWSHLIGGGDTLPARPHNVNRSKTTGERRVPLALRGLRCREFLGSNVETISGAHCGSSRCCSWPARSPSAASSR